MLQENVFFFDVSEDEGDFRLIVGILEDRSYELVHGGYACAPSNKGDVGVLVW